jgi:hypothetical protein
MPVSTKDWLANNWVTQVNILVKQNNWDLLVNTLEKLENSQEKQHKDSCHHAMDWHQLK